jgi:hypothetical protein
MNAEGTSQRVGYGAYQHSLLQCIARYGVRVEPAKLAAAIEMKEATLVSFGHNGRWIYDVPVLVAGGAPVVIRVVYAPHPGHVGKIITVLPPKFPREIRAEKCKELDRKERQRAKGFFRDLRKQEEAEDDF